jgi:hypothetical protein
MTMIGSKKSVYWRRVYFENWEVLTMAMSAAKPSNQKPSKSNGTSQSDQRAPSYTRSSLPLGSNYVNVVKSTTLPGSSTGLLEQQTRREKNIQVIVRVRPLSKREVAKGVRVYVNMSILFMFATSLPPSVYRFLAKKNTV